MPIFHCARGKKKWRKSEVFISEKLQPDTGPDAVKGGPARPVSSSRAQRRSTHRAHDQHVQGSSRPERPVSINLFSWWHDAKQTRWRVRSHATGCVKTHEELSRLRSDTGYCASGHTVKRVRSWQQLSLTRTAVVCPVVTKRVRSP
jgi:hypothetical protein